MGITNELKYRTINGIELPYREYTDKLQGRTYVSDYYVKVYVDDNYTEAIEGHKYSILKDIIHSKVKEYNAPYFKVFSYLDKDMDTIILLYFGKGKTVKINQMGMLVLVTNFIDENKERLHYEEGTTYYYINDYIRETEGNEYPTTANGIGVCLQGKELMFNQSYKLTDINKLKGKYSNLLDNILEYYKVKEVNIEISSHENIFNVIGSLEVIKEDGNKLNILEGLYVESKTRGLVNNLTYEEYLEQEEYTNLMYVAETINRYVNKKKRLISNHGLTNNELASKGIAYYTTQYSSFDSYLRSFMQEDIDMNYRELLTKTMLRNLLN